MCKQKTQTHRSSIFSSPARTLATRGWHAGQGITQCTTACSFTPSAHSCWQLSPGYPSGRGVRKQHLSPPSGGTGREEAWAGAGSQPGDFGAGIWRSGARSEKGELSRFWRTNPLSCKENVIGRAREGSPNVPGPGQGPSRGFWLWDWSSPSGGIFS